FPYEAIAGRFEWAYLGGVAFWMYLARYSYVALFNPGSLEQERRQDKQRRIAVKANIVRGTSWGAGAGALCSTLLVALIQLRSGHMDGNSAIFLIVFSAIAGGLIGA